jgi:hypothetical protein
LFERSGVRDVQILAHKFVIFHGKCSRPTGEKGIRRIANFRIMVKEKTEIENKVWNGDLID